MSFIFFLFILAPFTGFLLLLWLITQNKIFGKIAGIFWLTIIGLLFLGGTIRQITDKKELDNNDYYGEYIVDRSFFAGKQADWQYNSFRFEIKDNDSIYFYVSNQEKILKIYRGTVSTLKVNNSDRLIINMEQPTHHIFASNPTTFRNIWSFYLTFLSPKFNNVYFKKGHWKPISN